MKLKKAFSIMLTTVMALGVLSGCQKAENNVGSKKSESNTTVNSNSVVENKSSVRIKESTEVVFWNPFTGDDGKYMAEIVDNFNNENNDGIKVTTQTMAYDDYYAKLPIAISSGTDVPDVAILHIDRLPYYSSKALIQEMDSDIADMGLSSDNFIKATWNASVQADGKHYSVPLDTHPYVMFYNKTILRELGYSESDLDGLTGEKFIEMCKKAKDAGYYGIGFYYPGMSSVFFSLLKQFGGDLINPDDAGKAAFNSDSGIKAAEWVKDLLDKGYATKPGEDHVSLFKQGKSLFCADGIWSSTGMNEIDGLEWGEMFLPKIGEKGAIWASSHQLCLMTQKTPDEAKHKAAVTFIKYLSDHSINWAKAGQVAARIDVLKDPEFSKLPWSFAANQLDWFSYLPTVTTSGSFTDALNPVLVEYYSGNIEDAKTALDTAASNGEEQAANVLKQ